MVETGGSIIDFDVADLFKDSPSREYKKDQVLIYEGDPVSSLFYIEKGYVKIYNIINSGSERIIFIYGPGDVFPLSTYLSGSLIMRYFYVSMSDVEVRAIPADRLRSRIRNDIEVGEALVAYTNTINSQFLQRIEILSVNDARRKIIALLAFLVKKAGSKGLISVLDLHLTQQDIADMSGLTRESASRQLVRLRKEGLILKSNGAICIDVTRLNSEIAKQAIVL